MANPRIQPTRALAVLPSDNADIPYVSINTSGTDDGVAGSRNTLTDTTKDFITLGVYAGNIVYNLTTLESATIVNNPLSANPDTLLLNAAIMNAGDEYIIYQSSPFNGGQNTGCVLYVGTSGDLIVTTAGGDIVTFFKVQSGSFLPVQVIKVWESYTFPSGAVTTSAADIIALW
jgi:hypothetical protein